MGKHTREKCRSVLASAFFRFRKLECRENFYIFSDPRGGGTWLMELCSRIPSTAILWEPLHSHFGVLPDDGVYRIGPSRLSSEALLELESRLSRIFSGILTNPRVMRKSTLPDYLAATRLLVKMVCANQLLPWFVSRFSPRFRPIHLLRHPLAVATSQIRTFFPRMVMPEFLRFGTDPEQEAYLRSRETLLERLVATWCLHNVHLLGREPEGTGWHRVYYEELLTDPLGQLRFLSELWDVPIHRFISKEDIVRGSSSDFFGEFESRPSTQIAKWRSVLSEVEIAAAQGILNHFGVTVYSADDPLPRR